MAREPLPAAAYESLFQDYEQALRTYLRDRGWEETSNTPGSFWLWTKQLPDGRTVLCDRNTAIGIQNDLTPDPEPEGDD